MQDGPIQRQTLITQFLTRTEGGSRGHRGDINSCDFCGREMDYNPSVGSTRNMEKDSWGFCSGKCKKLWGRAFKRGYNRFIW